ncbi:MAG: hypothetical protein ABW171_09805 [Steroidobacter sp.]
MRSTRASAAWAGIALATSFLSMTILAQPHTPATSTVAQTVAAPSNDSLQTLQPEAAKHVAAAGVDATKESSDRGGH